MEVSVVIVNYKSWKALRDCLLSLQEVCDGTPGVEVIVVDNQSGGDEFEQFKTEFSNFTFLLNSGNNGFSSGCNLGAKYAQGTYLLFLNPDTRIKSQTLTQLLQIYRKYNRLGILSCLQYNENQNYYRQNLLFPKPYTFFGLFRACYRTINKSKLEQRFSPQNGLIYPDWVTGAVVLISQEIFSEVNGWNEDYWLYFEDVDLCKKVKNAGYEVAVTQKTELFHAHGGASRINLKTKALTKTEVIISKHTYISNHFRTSSTFAVHSLLIFSVLFEKILLSLLSLILFFNRKLRVNPYMLSNLLQYYGNALAKSTWISPRAVNYLKKNS